MSRRPGVLIAFAIVLAGGAAGAQPERPDSIGNQLQLAIAMLPNLQKLNGKPVVVAVSTTSSWTSLHRLDHAALERAIVAAATARGVTIANDTVEPIDDPGITLPGLAIASTGGTALAVEVELDGSDLDLHIWSFDRASSSAMRFDTHARGVGIVGWNTSKLTSIVVGLLCLVGGVVLWRVFRGARAVAAPASPEPAPPRRPSAPVIAAATSRPRVHEDGIALSDGAIAMMSSPDLELDRVEPPAPPASPGTARTAIAPVIRATPPANALAAAATAVLASAPASDGAVRIRGRYRVVAELGRGAMGVVYRAFDEQLEREVAIKALSEALRGHPDAYRLFQSEAKALAQLNHPNLVALYDQLSDDGEAYLVMELVEGATLDRVLERDGAYEWRDALLLVYHLCAGLAYAHGKSVIHRDIKPANIFIMPDGLPKLGDFGLARVLRELVIRSTEIRGTPLYMAPEQITGTMIDHRADLYAVGCTLFEVITGRPPFVEGQVMFQHLGAEPPRPTSLVASIPPEVERLMLDLLAKDAAERPQTAQIVRDRIRAIVT